jgi:methyl-accepting chemotaxis protein
MLRWLMNLKIQTKLLIAFMMVTLLTGSLGLIAVINLQDLNTNYTRLFNIHGKPLADIGKAGIQFQLVRNNIRDLLIEQGSDKQRYIDNIRQFSRTMKNDLEQYRKSIQTQRVKKEYQKLQSLLGQYEELQDEIIRNILDGHEERGLALVEDPQSEALVQEIDKTIDLLFDDKIKVGNEEAVRNAAQARATIDEVLIIAAVAVVMALAFGFFIAGMISRPVRRMVEAADRLALGDVGVQVAAETKDEIGMLMASFGRMIDSIREQALVVEKMAAGDLTVAVRVRSEQDLLGQRLKQMVETNNEVLGNINRSAEQVAAGAQQASLSSQNLSQGSTEQAASLEEITSSVTELAAQTKQNAVNAGQANELALRVKESAVAGNEQMRGMLAAMGEINESSENISKIIKVIDEIAFQTNILALNAAVEAARAGQHGKGFAVVAEEVRSLAARSANAAKETTALIEGSIKRIEVGAKLATDTAEALDRIVRGIAEAATLVGEIAVASNQQATAISQINLGVEQVSQVTQSNTSTAEETASASEELSSQAQLLKEMVGKFKLNQTGVPAQWNQQLPAELRNLLKAMVEHQADAAAVAEPSGAAETAGETGPRRSAERIQSWLDDGSFGKY